MNKNWSGLLCFVLLLYISNSCKKGTDNFTVGQDLVNINSNIVVNDSSTLHCYTIRTDSIVTSNTGEAMVGTYVDEDPNLGTDTVRSFVQIGVPSSFTLDNTTVCDSVALFLHTNNYYYGDTSLLYTLEIHQVMEDFDKNLDLNGFRYNKSRALSYASNSIASKRFYPKPTLNSDMAIRLNDDTKNTLYNLIINQINPLPDYSTRTTEFLKNFKGIALVSSNSKSILTFQANNSKLYLRFYTRTTQGVSGTLDFPMINANLQYNQIKNDVPATSSLSQIKTQKEVVPSKLSNHTTYCQAGTGYMTKFVFPYIKNILLTPQNIKILKAELLIYPKTGSFRNIPLAPKLTMYQTNIFNEITGYANDTTKNQLYVDYTYGEGTAYIVDVTSYITSIFQSNIDQEPELLATFLYADNSTKLSRVVISDGTTQLNSTRLRITYWRY
jgi:hypothetical protein